MFDLPIWATQVNTEYVAGEQCVLLLAEAAINRNLAPAVYLLHIPSQHMSIQVRSEQKPT